MVNTDFFKRWSPDMAYVLGFFAADGNMVQTKRNTHFLALHSADRDIILSIRKIMCSNHVVSKRVSDSGSVYRLQIGSKEIYYDLLQLGFCPGKSKRLSLPDIPKQFLGDFVRGYFDGDGNVWIGYVNKKRPCPTPVLQVTFTSGCQSFLVDLKKLLNEAGVRGGCVFTSGKGNFSRLQFSTIGALQLANTMYNRCSKLHLKRKKVRFDNFIKTRER